jgi:hypothetical protein
LHVRLDSRPKYYTYSPYKDAKYSTSWKCHSLWTLNFSCQWFNHVCVAWN